MSAREARNLNPSETWTDLRLVRACLDGSEDAWNAILDKYKRLIYSIPIKHGFSPEDASDIFQSVCVELLKELPRLREPRALAGWLIKVTAHKCFHWQRTESRYVKTENPPAPVFEGPDLDELLDAVEREQMLRDAMGSLTARCKKLVSMLFFDFPPTPYDAVAKKLGLARGSIGFIRRRCLDRLKRNLEERGYKGRLPRD